MKILIRQRPIGQILAALLLAATVASGSGCFLVVAGAAGAGTVAYLRGVLDSTVDHPYEATVDATNRAIVDLQFLKVAEKKDALQDVLSARTAQGTHVEVKIKYVSRTQTTVQIRVGMMGDEAVSMQILTKIQSEF